MNASMTAYEQLSLSGAARVDAVCDRFEREWKAALASGGPPPDLRFFMQDQDEPERTVLARELQELDRVYRARNEATSSKTAVADPVGRRGAGSSTWSPATAGRERYAPDWPELAGLRIVELLGHGGMGVVYKAWQESLGRYVAVKMLRGSNLAGPDQKERFRREARAVAQLRHPNLVQVYEFAETTVGAETQPYLVLEYVSGGSLADHLHGIPQPPRAAAQLTETLARALAQVHSQGIIHRDLKPGNVLLEFSDPVSPAAQGEPRGRTATIGSQSILSGSSPKITDFGLATFAGAADLTRSGDAVGTPSFMAPEQVDGRGQPVGPAADIYGLGALLYEMLTGRPPFKAETAVATLLQVKHDEPVPPRRLQPTIPRDLDTICLKCLAKEPARRYANALELAEDLRRFQAGETIHARPAGTAERFGRWCRRQPAMAGLIGALAASVLGGFATVTWLWLAAERNRTLAEKHQRQAELNLVEAMHQRGQAEQNFQLAQWAVDDYALKVSKDGRLWSKLRPLRLELLQSAVNFYEQLAAKRAADPNLRAGLADTYRRLGEITREIDDKDKAIACYQKAHEVYTELDRENPGQPEYLAAMAGCSYSLGLLYQEKGQRAEWERSGREAVRALAKLVERFPKEPQYTLDLARARAHLGLYYQRAGQLAAGEQEQLEALRLLEALYQAEPTSPRYMNILAMSRNAMGMLRTAQKNRPAALAEYTKARLLQEQLVKQLPDADDYQNHLAGTLNNLGLLHYHERRYQAAEKDFLAAAALNRALIGKLPEVLQYQHFLAANLSNLGHVARDSNRPEEAAQRYRESNDVLRKLLDQQPDTQTYITEMANNISCLGQLLKSAGKATEALAHQEEAIKLLEQPKQRAAGTAYHASSLRNSYWRRADILDSLGRFDEAGRSWDLALTLDEGANATRLKLYRARSMARQGNCLAAVKAAEALDLNKNANGEIQYEMARLYALAAAAEVTVPTANAEQMSAARHWTGRALTILSALATRGYFNDPEQAKEFLEDKDFQFIRRQPEGQSLHQLLERRDGK